MDRKSFIILIVSVLLLLGLSPIVEHFFPPHAVPLSELTASNQPPATLPPGSTAPGTSASASPTATAPASAAYEAPLGMPAGPEQTLYLTNEDLIFCFTSHGGGLKTVALRKFPAVINRTGATSLETNMVTLNARAPVPILTFIGNGAQGDNDFQLTQNGRVVTAEKILTNGLRLVKEFNIGTNYMFTARIRLENTSAQPQRVPARELVVGTATAIGPLDDPTAQGAFWYNGIKAQNIRQDWFANRTLGCIPGTPRAVYDEGSNNVVWTAVHNQFFTLAAIPGNPAPEVMIHPIYVAPPDLVGITNATSALLTNGFEETYVYPAAVLPAHQALEGDFTFYAGPKKYNRLEQIGEKMGNKLYLIMDFGKYTGFFSWLLLMSMNGLNAVGLGYGLTIIFITLIIKGIFWPLTRASTRSQKRMQILQPQLKAIAEKYKEDPVKKNQKTMEFMKEHKVSPLGSCLPMMIQVPVFIGFYYMLRNAIELRGVHFLWANDLSQPDTIFYLPILGGFPVNPLPLIMGATQLWQAHLLPPSPGMEPGQQKMMRYMPLMFIAMFYRMPAGLTLYWTVQNLLGILQTRITKTTDDTSTAAKPGMLVPKKKT